MRCESDSGVLHINRFSGLSIKSHPGGFATVFRSELLFPSILAFHLHSSG